jgi:2Fe-2S ferredoxin
MNECEVTFLPDGKKVKVRRGTTLLDAGTRARVQIRTRCGGKASCLMCKVHADVQNGLTGPTLHERRKLGSLLSTGTRLACQARVTGDTVVSVPEDPLKAAVRNQLARQQEKDDWI